MEKINAICYCQRGAHVDGGVEARAAPQPLFDLAIVSGGKSAQIHMLL